MANALGSPPLSGQTRAGGGMLERSFSRLTHNSFRIQSNPQLFSAQSLADLIKNESKRVTPFGSVVLGIRYPPPGGVSHDAEIQASFRGLLRVRIRFLDPPPEAGYSVLSRSGRKH